MQEKSNYEIDAKKLELKIFLPFSVMIMKLDICGKTLYLDSGYLQREPYLVQGRSVSHLGKDGKIE